LCETVHLGLVWCTVFRNNLLVALVFYEIVKNY